MTCGYCGSRRYSGELRCRTCGCRADDSLTGDFHTAYTDGALATQPRTSAHERASVQPIAARPRAVAAAPAPSPVPRQDRLFEERLGPKVVSIAPGRQRSKAATTNRPRRPAIEHTQGHLDFPPPAPSRKTLGTAVEARIYCEYPVATTCHRAIAAALDWSMVLMGYGLFLLIYRLMGGSFTLPNSLNVMMFGGMLALIGLAYGLLWTVVARSETAGTRWAQLRITTFDGDRPDPWQRLWRLAGSCLSLCTLVGLLWSLADEESLTWQDHISGTFPTPVPLNPAKRGK
jgi:uncharacterized RDD family membrane protein YckC